MLRVLTYQPREFTQEEVDLLQQLANGAGIALENARLFQETGRRAQEQAVLNAIATATSQSLDLNELLQISLDKVLEVTGREQGYIRLRNPLTGELRLAAHQGISEEYAETLLRHRTPGGKSDQVFESGEPLIINDPEETILREETRLEGNRSIGWFPLKGQGGVVGILTVATSRPIPFEPREVELVQSIGNIIGVALENARLFEQTKKQAVELDRSNKVKDEFLSVMSHELRTPLNSILGYTGMMQDKILGELSPEQEKAIAKVMARSNDLLSMIANILNVTKIGADETKVECYETSLKQLLDDLRLLYDFQMGKELALIWDYPSELSVVHTDGDKLKHILQSLIDNAIKFTQMGQVTISARHVPKAKTVEFKVTDTGIGIPKENIPIIFELFRQGDNSETRTYGGVGIGLYIAKKFSELLGGKIEVESELGRGATFTVMIPVS